MASSSSLKSDATMQPDPTRCGALCAYVSNLRPRVLEELYENQATCLAVFRDTPAMGREIVMRMLPLNQPIPQSMVASWTRVDHISREGEEIQVLKNLNILQAVLMPGGLPGWMLNSRFRRSLQVALVGGSTGWSTLKPPPGSDTHSRDVAFLDSYVRERWEMILQILSGGKIPAGNGLSKDSQSVLLHANLMKADTDGSPVITNAGFRFLLMDTQSQVWFYLSSLLDIVESKGMRQSECLNLLFELSFAELGKSYSTEGISEHLGPFLQLLREIGLVYQRKRKAGRFYPTRLAVSLTAVASGSGPGVVSREGYIVVETNYRVYAYTTSELQVSLLALFCEMQYRLPNMSVGVLARESCRNAFRVGITAEQILSFLTMHAHPRVLSRSSPLPPTVSDQVVLWERERNRFVCNEAYLYSQFLTQEDFLVVKNFAQKESVLLYNNDQQRYAVVTTDGHEVVRKYWKKYKKGGA